MTIDISRSTLRDDIIYIMLLAVSILTRLRFCAAEAGPLADFRESALMRRGLFLAAARTFIYSLYRSYNIIFMRELRL